MKGYFVLALPRTFTTVHCTAAITRNISRSENAFITVWGGRGWGGSVDGGGRGGGDIIFTSKMSRALVKN